MASFALSVTTVVHTIRLDQKIKITTVAIWANILHEFMLLYVCILMPLSIQAFVHKVAKCQR